MSKIRASAVLHISVVVALVSAGVLIYPLAKGSWAKHQDRRIPDRDYVIASDADQRMIVRSLLINEINKPPLCGPSGECPKEPIYFDWLSATLRSSDPSKTLAKYEVVTIRPQGSLVNRWDKSLPVGLQELLDHISQTQTHNANPMLPGVVYVADPKDLPVLGESGSCEKSISPRLVRISKAALQESEGLALVLIAITFCDGSGSPRVAKLKRDGAEWRVLEDY